MKMPFKGNNITRTFGKQINAFYINNITTETFLMTIEWDYSNALHKMAKL